MWRARCIATECLIVLSLSACAPRAFDLGFWFDPVAFSSPSIGGALTQEDLRRIRVIARAEIDHAFAGLPVAVSEHHDARYRVRVVQDLADLRKEGTWGGSAGESHAVPGFGGSGAVNFSLLAGYAVIYAPGRVDRDTIISAIGHGIGAAAVHEFVHQLLPTVPIDSSPDQQSYEYAYAGRRDQYYGRLHWNFAWPLLRKRIGSDE